MIFSLQPTSASLSSPSQLSSSGPTSPHHPPGTPHQQHHPTAAGLSAAGYNTWERGGGGGGASSVGAGGGSTSSLNNNKMFVPQPLGSAPGLAPNSILYGYFSEIAIDLTMVPGKTNAILFQSSQQLRHLDLKPREGHFDLAMESFMGL